MVLLHSLLARPLTAFALFFWAARALPENLVSLLAVAAVWALLTEWFLLREGMVMPQPLAPLLGVIAALCLSPPQVGLSLGAIDLSNVQGRVLSDPRLTSTGWSWVEFDLEWVGTRREQWQVRGQVRLSIRGLDWESVPPVGTQLWAQGVYKPDRRMFEVQARSLKILAPAPMWELWRRDLHRSVRSALMRLRGQAGPLTTALVLGQGDELTQEEKRVFREAGASPLLALSGLHLGVLALLLRLMLRRGPLRRVAEYLVATLLVVFVLLVGPLPSLVRALVFWLCLHVASWLRWEVDPLEITALGAVALILVFPSWATSPSFLLSVSAMAGILILSRDYQDFLTVWIGEKSAAWLSGGLAAGAGTGPVSLLMFGAYYPQAVFSNLIGMVPLIGLLWGTIVYLALYFCHVPIFVIDGLGWLLEQGAEGLFFLMRWLALPGAFSGWLGWLVWGAGLVPLGVLLYNYGKYGFLVRFPVRNQTLPHATRSGSSQTVGAELSDQPRGEATSG